MKTRHLALLLPISLLSLGGCGSSDDGTTSTDSDTVVEDNTTLPDNNTTPSTNDGTTSTDDNSTSSSGDDSFPQIPVEEDINASGKVIDGYISGADVFIDLNENGLFDSGEPRAVSDENGSYTIITQLTEGSYVVVANGGTDTTTGEAFSGNLKTVLETSSPDELILSPLTTVTTEEFLANRDGGLTLAVNEVATKLQISPELIRRDFIKDRNISLVEINQDVLGAIEKVEAFSDELNISNPIKTAWDNLENREIDLIKIGISATIVNEYLTGIAVDGPTTTTMEDGESSNDNDMVAPVDPMEGMSFEDQVKYLQEQRTDSVTNIVNVIKPLLPTVPKPDYDDSNGEISNGDSGSTEPAFANGEYADEVNELHSKIEIQFNEMSESATAESDVGVQKISAILDLNSGSFIDEDLKALQSQKENIMPLVVEVINSSWIENATKEFIGVVGEEFQPFHDELKNRLGELVASTTRLLTEGNQTTSYSDNISSDGTSLSITNENGTELSGSISGVSGKLVGSMYELNVTSLIATSNGYTLKGSGAISVGGSEMVLESIDIDGTGHTYVGAISGSDYDFNGKLFSGITGTAISGKLTKGSFEFNGTLEEKSFGDDTATKSLKDLMASATTLMESAEDVVTTTDIATASNLQESDETPEEMVATAIAETGVMDSESIDRDDTDDEFTFEDGFENFATTSSEAYETMESEIDGTATEWSDVVTTTNSSPIYYGSYTSINGTATDGEQTLSIEAQEDESGLQINNLHYSRDGLTLSFESGKFGVVSSGYSSTSATESIAMKRVVKDADMPPTIPNEFVTTEAVATTDIGVENLTTGDIPPALPTEAEGGEISDVNFDDEEQEIEILPIEEGSFDGNMTIGFDPDEEVVNNDVVPTEVPMPVDEDETISTNKQSGQITISGLTFSLATDNGTVTLSNGEIYKTETDYRFSGTLTDGESSLQIDTIFSTSNGESVTSQSCIASNGTDRYDVQFIGDADSGFAYLSIDQDYEFIAKFIGETLVESIDSDGNSHSPSETSSDSGEITEDELSSDSDMDYDEYDEEDSDMESMDSSETNSVEMFEE